LTKGRIFDTFGIVIVLPLNVHLKKSALYFWRIYEMDFPEGFDMKAPRGFRISFWSPSATYFHQ
jgi:hypothetical protein